MKVVLVGLMGSGKSILGKQLASRLSLQLVDLDDLIVEKEGKPIPWIFASQGEQAFRLIEQKALKEVLALENESVVATGGGAILSKQNRDLMRSGGQVIWLDAPAKVLAARISGDANRPLLNGVDPLQKMELLMQQRNSLYAEIANLRIDTHVLSDKEAVDKIIGFLSE